jgi:sn-glycerol 3-phosphate transport system permease protein
VHVGLIISCFVMGIPLLYALLVSTQNNSDVFAYRFTPGEDFQRNLELILSRDIFRNMLNSAMMAVTITVSKTILALLAGLAFVYFRFPGKWLVFGFVLLTLMMPTEILIVALSRFVAIDLKWGGTFQALVVPFIASATGTFLFRQHFANIPAELSEAAQLDGATPLQFLIRVLIPISWNTIGALAVIQFVYGWNMYLWPQLISQGSDFKVVTVALSAFRAVEGSNSIGPFMLVSVLVSIPPVIVFLLLQKQFMSGFALSRDK